MAAGGLALGLACLILIHNYAAHQIQALQDAREKAWSRSLKECTATEPLFQDLVQDVMRGDVPVPDGWLPSTLEDSASFRIPGLRGAGEESGSKQVAFVCNPRIARADPLSQPVDWVMNLFL